MTAAQEAGIGYGYANVGLRSAGWYLGRIVYLRRDFAAVGYQWSNVYPSVPPHSLATSGGLGENEFGEDG